MDQDSPAERTLETELFGKPVSFGYSETWLGYSMVGLRLLMAWVFLQAGLSKLASEGWTNPGGWSAEGFLVHGVNETNPFSGLFAFFTDHLWLVEPMVMYGQIAIGLALLFGVFFRFAALCGGLQMLLFWLGAFEGGFAAGLPIAHGYVFDSSFVYMVLLFGLGAWGAGRLLGLDARLEQSEIVQMNPQLRYLLG
ncbi:DoxX family protein [Natronobiforma cellulositropha]|uniref:DoxX family protein n=1 Tax=Natronobiforma cellulositropha TaxID=1679076 RepID=UPI0021D5873E|nr:DoxX family protein [Natronobiforma cellulositropha]